MLKNRFHSSKKNKIGINRAKSTKLILWKQEDIVGTNYRPKSMEILCSKIKRLNIFKMAILHKVINRVNAIPIKISADFSTESDKLILKFIWKFRVPRVAKRILKNNEVGGPVLPKCKSYHKAVVIMTVWNWHKNGHSNQWKRIESPE